MKTKKCIVLFTLATLLSTSFACPVYAVESNKVSNNSTVIIENNNIIEANKLSIDEEASLTGFLSENDVDSSTINSLIDKVNKGELWDCLKEEYNNIEPSYVNTSPNGETTEKYVYPDGSIKVCEINAPQDIQSRSVSDIFWNSGSGYSIARGAKVRESVGLATASFYADFELIRGGYDQINRVYDYSITTLGGTYSSPSLSIVRSKESVSYPAEAKLNFDFSFYNGSAGQTCWVKLKVGNDKYYSISN